MPGSQALRNEDSNSKSCPQSQPVEDLCPKAVIREAFPQDAGDVPADAAVLRNAGDVQSNPSEGVLCKYHCHSKYIKAASVPALHASC